MLAPGFTCVSSVYLADSQFFNALFLHLDQHPTARNTHTHTHTCKKKHTIAITTMNTTLLLRATQALLSITTLGLMAYGPSPTPPPPLFFPPYTNTTTTQPSIILVDNPLAPARPPSNQFPPLRPRMVPPVASAPGPRAPTLRPRAALARRALRPRDP